jgi:hypothetical protein
MESTSLARARAGDLILIFDKRQAGISFARSPTSKTGTEVFVTNPVEQNKSDILFNYLNANVPCPFLGF